MRHRTVKQFLPIFRDIKARYDRDNNSRNARVPRERQLVCADGLHMDCAALKLRKPAWTNDDVTSIRSPTGGIFFSIWITESGARDGRADYNIHAIKLRGLKSYRIAGIDFCNDFSAAFAVPTLRDRWPNVRTDMGCLTLMEGWFKIPATPDHFTRDALALMTRFRTDLSPIIDDLLSQRVRR